MIRPFDGLSPQIADSAYIDEAAVVVGDVVVQADANVWPNTTLRGDSGRIVVGESASVQDNAVMHGNAVLEAEAAIGHGGVVHEAVVAEAALVGMNAVVLDGAHVGERAIVGAGSVVTEGTDVQPETLVVGSPAEQKVELAGDETEPRAPYYRDLARTHRDSLDRHE